MAKPDFRRFRVHVETYAKRWGLADYALQFTNDKEPPGIRATAKIDSVHRSALVNLAKEWGVQGVRADGKQCAGGPRELKQVAKHEAIHIMLGEFSELAWGRCVSTDALRMAEEGLVRRLETLIED